MKCLFFSICLLMLVACFGGPKQGVAVEANAKAMQTAIVHTDINGDGVVDTVVQDTLAIASPVSIVHTDINGDGVVDTVVVIDNIGSQCSGKVVRINDGKHNWSVENTERDNAIVAMFYTDIVDAKIRDTVCKLLMPQKVRTKLDPIASWIINAQKSHQNVNGDYFYFVSRPRLNWHSNMKPSIESYYVKIEPSQAANIGKLRESLEGFTAPNTAQSKNAWWVYRMTISLDEPLKEVATIDGAKIYASSAAVAIEKAGKFAWLFINDYYAMGAAGLIEDVKVVENRYLIVSLTTGVPTNIYIVDTYTGAFVKIRKTSIELEQEPALTNKTINEFNKL